MTETAWNSFHQMKAIIDQRAIEVFQIVGRVWEKYQPEMWTPYNIEPEGVVMGHYYHGEDDTYLVPLKYLLAEDPEALILKDYQAYKEAQRQAAEEGQLAQARRDEAIERAQLARLIAKYGVPGDVQ